MARKRKEKTRKEWNQLLAKKGLSMNAGRHPKLVYSGDLEQLETALRGRKVRHEGAE